MFDSVKLLDKVVEFENMREGIVSIRANLAAIDECLDALMNGYTNQLRMLAPDDPGFIPYLNGYTGAMHTVAKVYKECSDTQLSAYLGYIDTAREFHLDLEIMEKNNGDQR